MRVCAHEGFAAAVLVGVQMNVHNKAEGSNATDSSVSVNPDAVARDTDNDKEVM